MSRSRVEAAFQSEGLDCVVLALDMGHRCGYVRVPETHPWFGLRYWDGTNGHRQPIRTERPFIGTVDYDHPDYRDVERIDSVLEVHCGVTFSDDQPNEDCEKGWWFGFDCAHLCDAKDPEIMSDQHREIWGSEPYATIKNCDYVAGECRRLAAQLAAVSRVEEDCHVAS